MSIQMSDSGTLSVTTPSPASSRRAPVDGCVALRFSLTCHSPGAPMRCTGLIAVRPAHSTSGESSTTASGPVTSARAWRRDTTGIGLAPEASSSSIDGLLEAVEQLADRLVDAGDARDRLGAGDDAHLVGGVARVVRLPQRVAAPPAPDVLVDDRHEVDRLARRLAQRDEERHVGRVQLDGLRVRVARQQRGDRLLRILEQRLAFRARRRTGSRSGRSPAGAAGPRRA